jgi:serine/threonine protein kinase
MSNSEATTGARLAGRPETPLTRAAGVQDAESDGQPNSAAGSPPLPSGAPGDDANVSPLARRPTVRGHQVGGLHATLMGPGGPAMTRLGRYHVVGRIATGGMAEVYLAVHGELAGFRAPVVLKKVLPHLACNPEFIDMFLDEARIASLLDHPNVVRIYEVGRSDNEYFLAMELVQGKPLQALLRRAQDTRTSVLEPRLAAFIVAQAASGLHHAHNLADPLGNALGLVHRDVSPHNILLSFEGSVKVIDFGVARALGRITDTQTGGRKGKFGYMSPEQARGEDLDMRADIFALGVVLWEIVTSRRLFQRDNDLATMRALIYDPIPKPSSVLPVAEGLESIIMRALTREPAQRFKTARDFAHALEKYVVLAGGATASDVGAVMKSHFAPDFATWQQTIRTAVNLPAQEDEPPPVPISVNQRTGTSAWTATGAARGREKKRLIFGVAAAAVTALVVLLLLADRKPVPRRDSPFAPRTSAQQAPPAQPTLGPATLPLPAPQPLPPRQSQNSTTVRPTPSRATARPTPAAVRATRRKPPAGGRDAPRPDPRTNSDRRPNPF